MLPLAISVLTIELSELVLFGLMKLSIQVDYRKITDMYFLRARFLFYWVNNFILRFCTCMLIIYIDINKINEKKSSTWKKGWISSKSIKIRSNSFLVYKVLQNTTNQILLKIPWLNSRTKVLISYGQQIFIFRDTGC